MSVEPAVGLAEHRRHQDGVISGEQRLVERVLDVDAEANLAVEQPGGKRLRQIETDIEQRPFPTQVARNQPVSRRGVWSEETKRREDGIRISLESERRPVGE